MAFEGMHPTFRQVPPREPRFSIHAVYHPKKNCTGLEKLKRESSNRTLRPSWAALIAATYPPGPTDPCPVSDLTPGREYLDA
jgi:hypothetical protein